MASGYHSTVKPYNRKAIIASLDSVEWENFDLSKRDQFNRTYLENDSWEWVEEPDNLSKRPVFKSIYKVKSDFYYYKNKDIDFHISPVFQFGGGVESESSVTTWTNTRGLELRGMIDEKVGFYSFLGENQITNPFYVREYINNRGVVPHEGFWKDFKENGQDFFTAIGYISFQASKHINFQFGHDRFFIGNGYRSLILSDFGPPHLFLKINTRVGRFKYTNLYTQTRADAFGRLQGPNATDDFPRKFNVYHHLSVNIGKHVNLGVFEAVAYGDSTGRFELGYLNPIIFYRAIEQQNGSKDNVILGGDFKVNAMRHLSFYGQFVFDEFKIDEIRARNGWWANKFSWQFGVKYIDAVGVKNLDLGLEYNYARPYTYSHTSIYTNFGNYIQELAHPLGANFKELLGTIRWQPLNKLTFNLKGFYSQYGEDPDADTNFGGNIFKNNSDRESEYGNFTTQGVFTESFLLDFTPSFQLAHNLFVEGKYIYRDKQSELPERNSNTHYVSLSIRLNIRERLHEF